MGSLPGAVLGALVLELLPQVRRRHVEPRSAGHPADRPACWPTTRPGDRHASSACVIILILIFKPGGLNGIWHRPQALLPPVAVHVMTEPNDATAPRGPVARPDTARDLRNLEVVYSEISLAVRGISLVGPRGRGGGAAGRQRRRQDDDDPRHHRPAGHPRRPGARGRDQASTARASTKLRAAQLVARGDRPGARGPHGLRSPDGRGEPPHRGVARKDRDVARTAGQDLRALPAVCRAPQGRRPAGCRAASSRWSPSAAR